MKRFSFLKRVRLRNTNQFSSILENPKIIGNLSYIKIYGQFNNKTHPRLGIIIPKKYVHKSHDRNRIKRLIRESFRKCQHDILHMDFVLVILKKKIIKLENQILTTNLNKLWFLLS